MLALRSIFLTTSFLTTLLSLLKSAGTGVNLSISNLSTLLFKLLKLFGKRFNLSISNLSTSAFKLVNLILVQNLKYQHVKHFLCLFLLRN